MKFTLGPDEQRLLLATARKAIYRRLGLDFDAPDLPITDALREEAGAFVTLHRGGRLRGCIGHIAAEKPLHETVTEVAVSSAFDDPRFPPVTRAEAPELEIEISVLSPFRRLSTPEEIRVGEHGILLRRGHRSGLLLPQVATEQGWDRDELLDHTCLKAGLPMGSWREKGTEIEIFSAFVFSEAQE
jgi:AmmeMemoRadiSam system protein A